MSDAFRVNAKNFFLTYAQCPITKEDMLAHLQELEGDKIKWIIIAHELHQDGGSHLHVQIEYVRKRNLRNAAWFDILDCHPNIQGTRRIKDVADYVLKDGDVLLHGITKEEVESLATTGKAPPKYAEVLSAGTYEAACEAVKRVDPRSWVNNGDRIRDNLRHDFTERFPEYPIFFE